MFLRCSAKRWFLFVALASENTRHIWHSSRFPQLLRRPCDTETDQFLKITGVSLIKKSFTHELVIRITTVGLVCRTLELWSMKCEIHSVNYMGFWKCKLHFHLSIVSTHEQKRARKRHCPSPQLMNHLHMPQACPPAQNRLQEISRWGIYSVWLSRLEQSITFKFSNMAPWNFVF